MNPTPEALVRARAETWERCDGLWTQLADLLRLLDQQSLWSHARSMADICEAIATELDTIADLIAKETP